MDSRLSVATSGDHEELCTLDYHLTGAVLASGLPFLTTYAANIRAGTGLGERQLYLLFAVKMFYQWYHDKAILVATASRIINTRHRDHYAPSK
jgi:hypothetical protein